MGHAAWPTNEQLVNGIVCALACRKGKGRISANGGSGYGGGAGGRIAVSYVASQSSLGMIAVEAIGELRAPLVFTSVRCSKEKARWLESREASQCTASGTSWSSSDCRLQCTLLDFKHVTSVDHPVN